jgi:hypothetical protein
MMRISVPRSSRWVAKLWRSACSVTAFLTASEDYRSSDFVPWRIAPFFRDVLFV